MKLPKFQLPKMPNRQVVVRFLAGLTEKAVVLAVILYMIVSVGRSVMKNYQANQRIKSLEDQIAGLEQEKTYLKSLIAYYQTDTFKELKAREELGLQLPGEQVIAVPLEDEGTTPSQQIYASAQTSQDRPSPNYVKWYQYFFGS